jgi:hypothetical protein
VKEKHHNKWEWLFSQQKHPPIYTATPNININKWHHKKIYFYLKPPVSWHFWQLYDSCLTLLTTVWQLPDNSDNWQLTAVIKLLSHLTAVIKPLSHLTAVIKTLVSSDNWQLTAVKKLLSHLTAVIKPLSHLTAVIKTLVSSDSCHKNPCPFWQLSRKVLFPSISSIRSWILPHNLRKKFPSKFRRPKCIYTPPFQVKLVRTQLHSTLLIPLLHSTLSSARDWRSTAVQKDSQPLSFP